MPEWIFFDGGCGLCHATVRLAARADRSGRFRYAPLGGPTFQSQVAEPLRAALPESLIVKTEDGRLLARSRAVLYIARRLGPWWRAVAAVAALAPAPLADRVYDLVARLRRRIFPPPPESCPVLPPHLRGRFDP